MRQTATLLLSAFTTEVRSSSSALAKRWTKCSEFELQNVTKCYNMLQHVTTACTERALSLRVCLHWALLSPALCWPCTEWQSLSLAEKAKHSSCSKFIDTDISHLKGAQGVFGLFDFLFRELFAALTSSTMDGRANPLNGPKGSWSCVFWNSCSGHVTHNC